jgi:hypothetical protein
MKAADLIMLELAVQWPISIVLTPHNMRAFQFCFRHLVNVKVSKDLRAAVQLIAFFSIYLGLLVGIAADFDLWFGSEMDACHVHHQIHSVEHHSSST